MEASRTNGITAICFDFPGFKISSVEARSHHTSVFIEQIVPHPLDCPNCSELAKLHGKIIREFYDVPGARGPVKITVEFCRGRCTNDECSTKTFKCDDLGQFGIKITTRLRHYIEDNCLKKSFSQLAKECGVSEGLVRKIANELCEYLDKNFSFEASKYISIDGVSLTSGKDKYVRLNSKNELKKRNNVSRTVISDSQSGKIIDVLPSEEGTTVLKGLLNLSWGKRVEFVVIDMSENFKRQVMIAFGLDVKVVVDRWHVIKNLNESMDRYRRWSGRESGSSMLTRFRIALTIREDILEKRKPDIYIELMEILNIDQDLRKIYDKHQEFLRIYDSLTRIKAEQRYESWKSSMSDFEKKHFSKFISNVDKWREDIFAYWSRGSIIKIRDEEIIEKIKNKPSYSSIHDDLMNRLGFSWHWKGLTNGRAERANQSIRNINRAGGSYSFKMLRAKILFSSFDVVMEYGICSECRKVLRQNRKCSVFREFSRERREKNLNFPDSGMLLPTGVCDNCAGTSQYVEAESTAITRPSDVPVEDWLVFPGLRHVWSVVAPRLKDDEDHMCGVRRRFHSTSLLKESDNSSLGLLEI